MTGSSRGIPPEADKPRISFNEGCRKWLKYYLDFCLKYHHEKSKKESLPHFLQKLKDKNQTEEQRKQALHAVSIIYEVKNTDYDKIRVLKNIKERISREEGEDRPFSKYAFDATRAGLPVEVDQDTFLFGWNFS